VCGSRLWAQIDPEEYLVLESFIIVSKHLVESQGTILSHDHAYQVGTNNYAMKLISFH